MENCGGWQFWLNDGDCVRQFMLAEPDEVKLREHLRKKQPTANILSRKMVPGSVIQILKMKPGDLCEWVASIRIEIPPLVTPT